MADYAEGEDSTANTNYSPYPNTAYQYYGQPENTNQPIQRPPIRRQTEGLQGVLEPLTNVLGPEAEVRKFSKTDFFGTPTIIVC